MLTLPDAIVSLLNPFAPMFQARTWTKAQVLLVGAVLATRKRTVTSALRVMGLSDEPGFARYHHVLSRAVWSSLQLSRVLLLLLVEHLGQGDGPLVFGIDETLERRRGKRIKARGVYRDAVRSSRSYFVKASGLRWISLMWLSTIPWAHRTWALPVLTALAPSERYCRQMGRTHKKITDWARQMIVQLRRWLPNRPLVVVADSSYAALDLLHFCQSMTRPVTFITRLRLDAALYEPAPPRLSGQMGRPRIKGQRLPTLGKLLECPDGGWTTMSVGWYDGATRTVEIVSQNSGLVSLGQATRAHSLGPHSRPSTTVRLPGSAVHRSCGQSKPDHRVVRVALADRGDVPGDTRPSGSRDSTPVVGPRHIPDHSCAVGTVLLDNSRSTPAGRSSTGDSTISGMVCQVSAHFRRCDRSGAPSPLECFGDFLHIVAETRYAESPNPAVQQIHRIARLRRLNVQSRANSRRGP